MSSGTIQSLVGAIEDYLAAEGRRASAARARSDGRGVGEEVDYFRNRLEEELRRARPSAVAVGGQFRRILVPVEGSGPAGWATRVAQRMASEAAAQLLLVNVIEMPSLIYAAEVPYQESEDVIRAELTARARQMLQEYVRCIGPELRIETRVLEGQPVTQISRCAADWGADLVVIGAHARGRLATFVLGSTAEGVIRHVGCPVLVVAHEPVTPVAASVSPAKTTGAGVVGDA